jgi:hypothetical protein
MKLGDIAKDTLTDFQGTIVARHEYLNGCVRLSIQPRELKDGKPVDATTFDIEQLALVSTGAPRTVLPKGGPHNEPSLQSIPSR